MIPLLLLLGCPNDCPSRAWTAGSLLSPADGAEDVPLDAVVAIQGDGRVFQDDLRLEGPDGEVPWDVEFLLASLDDPHDWYGWGLASAAVLRPVEQLAPGTAYTIRGTVDDAPVVIGRFTTGTDLAAAAPAPAFEHRFEPLCRQGFELIVDIEEDGASWWEVRMGDSTEVDGWSEYPDVSVFVAEREWRRVTMWAREESRIEVRGFDASGDPGTWTRVIVTAPRR